MIKLVDIMNEGIDDSWTVGDETVTLRDILELTKDVPVTKYDVKKLSKIVLNWNGDPEHDIRIEKSNLSYPALVIATEKGRVRYILDGNHRIQKAIRNNLKTVNIKIIKPCMLSDKAKRILY